MPTAKKKKSTKTTKKAVATKTHKKAASRTCCKKGKAITSRERMHVYIVTALSITAGILLCIDATIMAVA